MKFIVFLLLSSVVRPQEVFEVEDPEPEPEIDSDVIGASSSSKFTCDSAISRLFTQPFDKLDSYFKGQSSQFTDYTFYFKDQLYWQGFTPNHQIKKFGKKGLYWNRLSTEYPRATLWGSKGVSWDDANQGQTATCYLVSGMASVADYAGIIEKLFVVKEVNDQGIYAKGTSPTTPFAMHLTFSK